MTKPKDKNPARMNYFDRLLGYEADKERLRAENLSAYEFSERLKALAEKWRI